MGKLVQDIARENNKKDKSYAKQGAADIASQGSGQDNPYLSLAGELEQQQRSTQSPDPSKAYEAPSNYILFATLGMGEAELKAIFSDYAGDPDVTIVFRGIADGDTLPRAFKRLHALFPGDGEVPNVQINPALFNKYAIDVAPTLLMADEVTGEPLAIVRGITSRRYLTDRFTEGEEGTQDFGVAGPLVEFAEQDMIKMMQARASQIDWEEQKRRALDRAVGNQPQFPLPLNQEAQLVEVDMRVIAPRDIRDGDGNVVIREGEVLDPLKHRAFDISVIVFNSNRQEEIEWAKRALDKGDYRNPVLITSELDVEAGFKGYAELGQRLGQHVTLLNQEVANRFGISGTPTVVFGRDGKVYRQEEVVE
jgi:conjugal transfer pilus assembly protein TraW